MGASRFYPRWGPVTELTLDETLSLVEGFIRKQFPRLANHHLEDDLLQEAHIKAWKDYLDGLSPKAICVRAKFRLLNLMKADDPQYTGEQWTGHITQGRDHQDHKKGRETRERILEFVQGYRKLHGHEPMVVEIAKATGVDKGNVKKHMDRMYLFSGAWLTAVATLDDYAVGNGEDKDIPVIDRISHKHRHGNFEEEICEWLDTTHLLITHVPDKQDRVWAYLWIYGDKTQSDIAREFGVPRHVVEKAIKRVATILKEATNGQAIG